MKSIWKVMLAVCCLGMTIGCGTNPSKNENVKETLPALVVNGTQLMNTEGDTVVLHGVSYGWHQFWPRFYNASSVAYLVNDIRNPFVTGSHLGEELLCFFLPQIVAMPVDE